MRKLKKITAILLSACIAVGVLSGCGGKEVTADEYVLAAYKLVVNRNSKSIKDIGVPESDILAYEEEFDKSVEEQMTEFIQYFQKDLGTTIEKELVSDYLDAYLGILSKLTATASIESENNNEAVVKLTSTYADFDAIGAETIEIVSANAKNLSGKDLFTEYMKTRTEVMKAYEPSSDTQSVSITVKKNSEGWALSVPDDFISQLETLVIKSTN